MLTAFVSLTFKNLSKMIDTAINVVVVCTEVLIIFITCVVVIITCAAVGLFIWITKEVIKRIH